MNDPTILQTLSALPHFHLLDRELLERVAEGSRTLRLRSGETLFREGDPCRGFFAVRTGAIKLYRLTPDGREQVVHNLGAGQTFAEAAFLNMGRFPAWAVATESPTDLVEIGGESFEKLFREEPRLAAAMVGSLSMRLISLVERIEELSLVNAGSRLARYLMHQPGHGPSASVQIDLPMSKKDLAAHLSMSPETLSRLLRRWQDLRWIDSDRARVTVLVPQRLLALADGEEPGSRG